MTNLIDFTDKSITDIDLILNTAKEYKQKLNSGDIIDKIELKSILQFKKVGLCFFENSTRTKISFEVAAKNLGAETYNLDVNTSSAVKGETLIDTLKVLECYGMDCFVIRHNESGIFKVLERNFLNSQKLSFINAGDGTHAHPSQALLDLFTIKEKFDNLSDLRLTIVGDLTHSRVAKSNIELLNKLGVKVNVFAPGTLFPYYLDFTNQFGDNINILSSIDEVIENSNVIMLLRLQKERMSGGLLPNSSEYHKYFGINDSSLIKVAERGIFIMHPGPVNYGLEITSKINQYEKNLILNQVENGICIRMSILNYLLNR